MDDLSFDPVKVDTSLAKKFIEMQEIIEEPEPGKAWDYERKIVFNYTDSNSPFCKLFGRLHVTVTKISVTGLNKKLRNLSKKIEENSELLCQLEYLMRKTDVDETRNCHLKLISQYLRFEGGGRRQCNPFRISMEESTPLYHLGHVATVFRDGFKPVLFCKKTTAPTCQLFHKLCLDVGLELSLYYTNKSDTFEFRSPEISIIGCTLAITEEADLDSAVDVFLNSSAEAPWRIERIYVQESVHDQVVEAVEARCTREPSERCVDAFRTARGRRVECGAGAGAGGGVPLRAYRGVRDLLALLPCGGSLSLWCGALAPAHEIALAASADLVWINHYAVFEGPPSASIPLYNFTISSYYVPESVHAGLVEMQRKWITVSLDERKAIVLDVLEKVSDTDAEDNAPGITGLAEEIAGWTPVTDHLDIAPDRITMVIDRPHTEGRFIKVEKLESRMLGLLKSAILGHISLTLYYCFPENIISELNSAGVPISTTKVTDCKTPDCTHEIEIKPCYDNIKKVIHSRYGTIYSN